MLFLILRNIILLDNAYSRVNTLRLSPIYLLIKYTQFESVHRLSRLTLILTIYVRMHIYDLIVYTDFLLYILTCIQFDSVYRLSPIYTYIYFNFIAIISFYFEEKKINSQQNEKLILFLYIIFCSIIAHHYQSLLTFIADVCTPPPAPHHADGAAKLL